MSDPSTPRQPSLSVTWQGRDVSRDLAPYLLGLTYADNLSGAADDLTLEIEDREHRWSKDWRPQTGDTVIARLQAEPWISTVRDLRLGTFAHDKIRIGGPPSVVALSCVSAPLASGLRRRKRTRTWSNATLRQIAADVAERAGLSLQWTGAEGRRYSNRKQVDRSDLDFLEELCGEVGRCLKVTEGTIAIFEEHDRDTSTSIGKISLVGGEVLAWEFDSDDSARYGSCVISFYDPRSGKTQRAQFPPAGQTVDGLDPNGQTLEINLGSDDLGEAADKARALLRAANRFATSGTLTTRGDPGLVAGVVFELVDSGGFDGRFVITKATHRPCAGYVCELQVRRTLEGF